MASAAFVEARHELHPHIGATGTEIAGAWTIPEARRQGAQLALLHARLTFAANLGVDRAMVVTQPGSASHRYAERQGFRPVYTRAKWQRAGDAFVR
jgi:GNAT superfamily N-acetyltransferase